MNNKIQKTILFLTLIMIANVFVASEKDGEEGDRNKIVAKRDDDLQQLNVQRGAKAGGTGGEGASTDQQKKQVPVLAFAKLGHQGGLPASGTGAAAGNNGAKVRPGEEDSSSSDDDERPLVAKEDAKDRKQPEEDPYA